MDNELRRAALAAASDAARSVAAMEERNTDETLALVFITAGAHLLAGDPDAAMELFRQVQELALAAVGSDGFTQ